MAVFLVFCLKNSFLSSNSVRGKKLTNQWLVKSQGKFHEKNLNSSHQLRSKKKNQNSYLVCSHDLSLCKEWMLLLEKCTFAKFTALSKLMGSILNPTQIMWFSKLFMHSKTPFPASESAVCNIIHNTSSTTKIIVWFKLILQFYG